MQTHFAAYYATGKRMAEAYVASGLAGGNAVMGAFDEAAAKIQDDVQKAMSAAQTMATNNFDASLAAAVAMQWWVMGMSGLLILVVFGVGLFLRRSVLSPIIHAGSMAQELADGDGDLTRRLDGGRGDEIGDVSRGINRFVERVRDTVVAMRSVADQLRRLR